MSDACIETTLARANNLSGIDFEVRGVDCDTIAKDYLIWVLASEAGHRRKTVLFTYEPLRDDDVPTIEIVGRRILISIAAVDDVGVQLRSWHDMQIEYRIGAITYPSPTVK